MSTGLAGFAEGDKNLTERKMLNLFLTGDRKKMRAFCCWSGGKDSALAFYKAKKSGIDIFCLVNMVEADGRYSRSHGLSSELLRIQAAAIDTPIIQRKTLQKDYEEVFKETILELKEKGVEAGIFGDIYLKEHRDWVERVCKEAAVEAVFPLWHMATKTLIEEFVKDKFRALLVAVRADCLGQEWLGREIDALFVEDIKILKNIDPCGENGEFHSFVYDGPVFKEPVKFKISRKVFRGNSWFLEIGFNNKQTNQNVSDLI